MRQQATRGAVISMFLAAVLAVSVSASGQGMSGSGTGGQPAGQGAGPVVRKLSVNDAVQMALEQNLNLQVERVNPQIQEMSIAQARGAYRPNLTSGFATGSADSPASNIFSGTGAIQTNGSLQWSFGANQVLPTGGNYSVSWGTARATSNSLFNNINPLLSSSVAASFTQPFMRNFRIDSARQQLLITKKNREISDVQLRQTVLATVRAVKDAYWSLSNAVSSLAVQRQSLDLAQESLRQNQARVKIGTMAPIDIIQAQAEVASREESVIQAETTLGQTEDRFRALIMDPQTPNFWAMTFELTDAPVMQLAPVDADAAVRNALDKRTDLTMQRKNIEENDIALRYIHNQTLPDVSLKVSYGLAAQGGTLLNYDYSNVLNPVLLGVLATEGYGSMYRTLFGNNFPAWSIGMSFSYPIGNSAAEANFAKARLQYGQAQTELRISELNVATEVRDAARAVNANMKRVDSTRASRELMEKKLEAEQKKFAAGMSTFFFVMQAQRDLAQAQNAELQATLDYTRSLVDFETVQEAPVSGMSGSIVIGG